jgi:hypothetical protein
LCERKIELCVCARRNETIVFAEELSVCVCVCGCRNETIVLAAEVALLIFPSALALRCVRERGRERAASVCKI